MIVKSSGEMVELVVHSYIKSCMKLCKRMLKQLSNLVAM